MVMKPEILYAAECSNLTRIQLIVIKPIQKSEFQKNFMTEEDSRRPEKKNKQKSSQKIKKK